MGKLEALETRVQFHDDLIMLHDHGDVKDGLDDLEERLCSRIDGLTPPEPDPIVDPIVVPDPPVEPPEPTVDKPPKSRTKRKSIADRYYSR